ncbi:response regulator [Microbacterium sp. YY-01]|uniref:response regulator n=1 Tax=Microbacterium sp. YY-01 TaxID=3421634 RepID=UPI003D174B06
MSDIIRVVIVDDHETVRSGITAILSTDPTITIAGEAENGFDALALCTRENPHVALVDLRMPGTDGTWATQRITRETTTRVLVLTTFDSDDLIAQALAAGASGYLLKTVRGVELIQAVRHVAEDRHVVDPAIAGGIIARLNAQTSAAADDPLDATVREALEGLTRRERDVLRLVAAGLTNQQIADHLAVGVTTVKTHVGALYTKTGVASRVQLGRLGDSLGDGAPKP